MKTNTALLVLDMQEDLFAFPNDPIYNEEYLLDRSKALISKANAADITVIYTLHTIEGGDILREGTPGWQIHKKITPANGAIIVRKSTPDPFLRSNLENQLRSRNITNLMIIGIQTEICIDTACRRAFSMGFHVILVKDLHSTMGSDLLTAAQIIEHHNLTLGDWFVELAGVDEIDF